MNIQERQSIHVHAPARVDLAGTPTDVSPFKENESGFILNTAIGLSSHINLKPLKGKGVVIRSDDYDVLESFGSIEKLDLEGPLRLLKACAIHVNPRQGFELSTRVDIPPGSGLGGSAALAVAILGALRYYDTGMQLARQTLIDDALFVENEILNNINGGQDQYAAALGGFHSFVFTKEGVSIKSVDVSSQTRSQLERRSLLCNSGVSHISGNVLDHVMASYVEGDMVTTRALRAIKGLVPDIETALTTADLEKLGLLLQSTYDHQLNLPGVVTADFKTISSLSQRYGAIAGKVIGAGGGGCIYLFCEEGKKEAVEQAMLAQGVQVLPFITRGQGVTID